MKSAGSRRLRKGSLKWLTLIVGSLGAALIVVWLTCAYTGGMEYAAANGHTTLLRSYLLLPGTNVNKAETLWGQTPLYGAVINGHMECVKLLLAAPAIEVNRADYSGCTPLYRAAQFDSPDCVELLLSARGIDENAADDDGRTPLMMAAENGCAECVKLLLAAPGIDVNRKDTRGATALQKAADNGHAECVKLLLAAGADVNSADNLGFTPLHRAVYDGDIEYVQLLLSLLGEDISRWKPLALAVLESKLQKRRQFVSVSHYELGPSSLDIRFLKRDIECAKQLLSECRTDVQVGNGPNVPLFKSAGKGYLACVELLLTAGADIHRADSSGYTPLHWAVFWGRSDYEAVLLAARPGTGSY